MAKRILDCPRCGLSSLGDGICLTCCRDLQDEVKALEEANTLLLAVNDAARDFIYARLHHPNRVKEKVQFLVAALDKYAKWDPSQGS